MELFNTYRYELLTYVKIYGANLFFLSIVTHITRSVFYLKSPTKERGPKWILIKTLKE